MGNLDDDKKLKMEKSIDSFILESASQYTYQELLEKFSTSKSAIGLLYEYIEMKANSKNTSMH